MIVPGAADIRDLPGTPHPSPNTYIIDANHDAWPNDGETLIADNDPDPDLDRPNGILDISDVVYGRYDYSNFPDQWTDLPSLARSTNLCAFQPCERFLTDNVGSPYEGQPVVKDEGIEGVWDAADHVVYGGMDGMWLLKGHSQWGITKYIDSDHDGNYDKGECILNSADMVLDDSDTIVTAGAAGINGFQNEIKFTDDERADGSFDADESEAIVNDADGDDMIDPGEIIVSGRADTVGEDRDRDGIADISEVDLDGDNPKSIPYPDFPNFAADHKAYMYACETMPKQPPEFELVCPLRYIDADSDITLSIDDAIIRDGGGADDFPNGRLDVGTLDGTGTDDVLIPGSALTGFARVEKFVDGNDNDAYDVGEAIVYDWYWYDPVRDTFEGEFILAGDPAYSVPNGLLAYLTPAERQNDRQTGRARDSILLASDTNRAAMTEVNDRQEQKYIDRNHSDSYDGFYTGTYEPIISSINNELEEGNLDDTGIDHVLAAGYASMRLWTAKAANMAWADDDHDGGYQSNEAIVDDAGGDGIITSIGTDPGDDQIIVPGDADLSDFTNMKYVDADGSGDFSLGELVVDDSNPPDSKIQNDEIAEPGPVPSLLSFTPPASTDYRYCDTDQDDTFDLQEAIVYTPSNPDILETGDVVVVAGYAGLMAFADDPRNMFVDYDHDGTYDVNEAIIYDDGNGNQILETSDQIVFPGAATSFDGMGSKYATITAGAPYSDGCLIVNDDDGDNMVAEDEIVTAGTARLRNFNEAIRYADHDHNGQYDFATGFGEAIIVDGGGTGTDPDVLEIGDKIETVGYADLQTLDGAGYRYSDADHDDIYDAGEAIIVEADGDASDDILEDSDVVVVDGEADIGQFPSNFKFLDDEANSGAYEDGEAIVNDSNENNLLDLGEIVTGGWASLRQFAGGARYSDGGEGVNARNSQYDQDEAIIRDGNSNNELDTGPLNGAGNDEVLTPGKAGLTQFDADERYVDANGNGEYDGGQYSSEDIYLDRDSNGMVTLGNDALEYFVVENSGTATNSDLAAVKLWADRDKDGQFELGTDDAPAVASLIPDASDAQIWYEGPATAPPLSASSTRASIDYTVTSDGQRFFVTVDTSSTPTDGRDIQMGLPLNGVKTLFGAPGPSDAVVTNAYAQKIDFADPDSAEITSHAAGDVFYGQISLQAAASDTVQVGKVEFYNGPPGGANTPIAMDDDGAPWEALWDSSSVECGFYTLYVRVYDRTYLRSPESWVINHYTDSPGIPVTIAISASIELAEGWNLVSAPVEAFDTSMDSVLSSISGNYTAVWSYDAVTPKWLRYDMEGPDFLNDLDTMQRGVGYWILMSSPGTLNINGTMPETGIELQTGWNLVGCNSLTALDDMESAMSSINGEFSVWTLDQESGEWLNYDPQDSFNDLNSIEPGKGYWIYTPEGGTWILPF